MTTVALGHVIDITEKRPASFITTAEEAAGILYADGCPETATAIHRALRHIRADRPTLVPYLTHPNIIVGIANGRCNAATLIRWLEELEYADVGDDETGDVDDCFP
jgi:hypothetical protein